MCAQFFVAGMEAKWHEGYGRTLLGDDTWGEAVMLWPITFRYFGVLTSTGIPSIYTQINSTICIDAFGQLYAWPTYSCVVGTVRPLPGSRRNGQQTLHLFQKYLLSPPRCLGSSYVTRTTHSVPICAKFHFRRNFRNINYCISVGLCTWHYIAEYRNLHIHRWQNLSSSQG